MNNPTSQTVVIVRWLCITAILIAAGIFVVSWHGCDQQIALDTERVKAGQVYVSRGWVTVAPVVKP